MKAALLAGWASLTRAPAADIQTVDDRIEEGRRLGISERTLWEASRHNAPLPTPRAVFAPYRPAPGVLPPSIVMDSGTSRITSYAEQESLFQEGLAFLGYPYLAQLTQRAEYRMISEKWAEHCTRKWIKLTGDDERVAELEAELERLNVRAHFRTVTEYDGFFGRGQLFLDFGDAEDSMELASYLVLDKAKVNPDRPLKRIVPVEPIWSYPGFYDTSNPLSPQFYQPRNWYVYGRTVDASRLLTFVSRDVPDIIKPAYAFGGLAMSQMAKPYVDNWLSARQSVNDMLRSYSVFNLGVDLDQYLADGNDHTELFKRVDLFNRMRDNRGCMVTDKNTESLENIAVPITGIDKLQSQALEQLSTVSGIPLVILLGVTPSGLNASSDGEVRSFYAAVKAKQERIYRKPLITILQTVMLSLWGEIDNGIGFEFEDLWEMSDKDKADIRKSDAEADVAYINAGVVDPEEARERLRNDETSLYHGVDLSAPAPELPDDPAGSFGDTEDDEDDQQLAA